VFSTKCIPDFEAPKELKIVDWVLYVIRHYSYIKWSSRPGAVELLVGVTALVTDRRGPTGYLRTVTALAAG
jgi:hypothetical protein